jgi:hypothetical protein
MRLLSPLTGSFAVLLFIAVGACASSTPANRPPIVESIGCRGPYEDVAARLVQLRFDLKISADQEFNWVTYANAYRSYAEARTAAPIGAIGGPSKRRPDDGVRFLRRSVRAARDQLYMSLSPEQKIYANTMACRLAYP